MIKAILSLFIFSISISAQAVDSDYYFNIFKDSGLDFEKDGRICEEIALLELRDEFGPNYEVLSGIGYNLGKLTVGELDAVVKHQSTGKVVLVAEVKCWKNPKGGLKKAHSQRARFENSLSQRPRQLTFENISKNVLSVDNFKDTFNYRSIAQKGSAEFGFDQELELTLRELTQLRSKLLKCQSFGPCKRPQYSPN